MFRKMVIVIILVLLPFLQGCALIGVAVSAAAAYGISKAFD
ncbi:MAG: hypothetical protein ABIH45_04680 [Candidatus Omnitrophota bacterium]